MNIKTAIISAFAILSFYSCSSITPLNVERDRNQMKPLISQSEMVKRIDEYLNRIPGINAEEKESINQIHAEVMTSSWEINQKIREYKILLFKYMSDGKLKQSKINYTKKQIVKNYKLKLDIMFNAFSRVKKVLGKQSKKLLFNDEFVRFHKEAL